MKHRIGTSHCNDRWDLYEFTRNSRLPHGTFGRRRLTPTSLLYIATAIIAVLSTVFWSIS